MAKKPKGKKRSASKIAPAGRLTVPSVKSHTPGKAEAQFRLPAYLAWALGIFLLSLGVLDGLKSAVELMPPLDRLASYWLLVAEFPWRRISEALGLPYSQELGTWMTCILILIMISISATSLEDKHTPFQPARSIQSAIDDWHVRVASMLVAGSVATIVMVWTTEALVFNGAVSQLMQQAPWWCWPFHMFAMVSAGIILIEYGFKRLAEIFVAGVLCGLLFFVLSLPASMNAHRSGPNAVETYRTLFSTYAFAFMPWRVALITALAAPAFLIAQLMIVGGLVAAVLSISWLASLK